MGIYFVQKQNNGKGECLVAQMEAIQLFLQSHSSTPYLVGKPERSRWSDPFASMDSRIHPDSRPVDATSTELWEDRGVAMSQRVANDDCFCLKQTVLVYVSVSVLWLGAMHNSRTSE